MRKLASIRRIDALNPIENADAIECAVVGGWKVVVKRGEFAVGDLAVYCEIDSWIPTEMAPFLSKGKEPRVFEGVRGERLRTIKLRGQLSQGLLLPIPEDTIKGAGILIDEGLDLTDHLGIKKWEKPMNAQLAGLCKGNFPSQIPKTDQERVQNLTAEIGAGQGSFYEVTEKLEGSSMTCYLIDGEFGVCSRNLDLKRDENNAFWKAAIQYGIEEKMRTFGNDFAIQGELIGPGIQDNIYALSETKFYVFDVYDIADGRYLNPQDRRELIYVMGLDHVPVLNTGYVLNATVEQILNSAEGQSVMAKTEREGIVFKHVNGGMTFKAISNRYLLGEK